MKSVKRRKEDPVLIIERRIRQKIGLWIFAMIIVFYMGAYAGHHADKLEETARIFFFGISLLIFLAWLATYNVSRTLFTMFDRISQQLDQMGKKDMEKE